MKDELIVCDNCGSTVKKKDCWRGEFKSDLICPECKCNVVVNTVRKYNYLTGQIDEELIK